MKDANLKKNPFKCCGDFFIADQCVFSNDLIIQILNGQWQTILG